MNGTESKIEIFKPFEEAWAVMKKILFQPFDLAKWMVIGFAAFLANLSGGVHFNFPVNWNQRSWHPRSNRDLVAAFHEMPDWARAPGVIAAAIISFVVVILVFSWLGARGRFIFTDCIVKNRGAIVAPWREFRKEANSFFLFSMLVALVFILVSAALALAFLVPVFLYGKHPFDFSHIVTISGIALVGLTMFTLAIGWALISHFMLPVMYRQRCRAWEAARKVASLMSAYPGEFLLYCLFIIVLVIGTAITACVVMCATCCIAAIPYIGTVILLPIFVTLRSFSFCFFRQFGPDYDVWQGVPPPEPAAIAPPSVSPPPPPLQS